MASTTLNEVVLELQEQNRTLDDVKEGIKAMLTEDIMARKKEERSAGDRREAELEAKRKSTITDSRTPSFKRGLLGNSFTDGLDNLLSSAFGAAGGLIPALAMGAGRSLRFGAAALALNTFVDDAIEYVFDGFTFDDALTEEEKTKIKNDVQTGINAGIGAKFLGLGWRKSLGIGLGVAASDLIGDALQERFATDESGQFVMSNPLSGLGVGGEDIKIDLSDPLTRDIMGAAIGLVGIEIARYAARGFLRLGAKGIAIALGAAGFATLSNLMGNLNVSGAGTTNTGTRGKAGGAAKAAAASARRAAIANLPKPSVTTNLGSGLKAPPANMTTPPKLPVVTGGFNPMSGLKRTAVGAGVAYLIAKSGAVDYLTEVAEAQKDFAEEYLGIPREGLIKIPSAPEVFDKLRKIDLIPGSTSEESFSLAAKSGENLAKAAIDSKMISAYEQYGKSREESRIKKFQPESYYPSPGYDIGGSGSYTGNQLKEILGENYLNSIQQQNINIGTVDNSTNVVSGSKGGGNTSTDLGSSIDYYHLEKRLVGGTAMYANGTFNVRKY